MSILKGQLETDKGDVLFPRTSADMVEGINTKQLLLNNDFQVNQRGQNIYDYTNKSGHTVDMWLASILKVSVLSDGWVKVENLHTAGHYFQQKFGFLRKGKYAVALNVRNIKGSVSLHYEQEGGSVIKIGNLKNGRNTFTFTAANMKNIAIYINTGSSVEIEYIDLFEGDAAFHHVKELYDIELLRCQTTLLPICSGENFIPCQKMIGGGLYAYVYAPNMIRNPKLISSNIQVMDNTGKFKNTTIISSMYIGGYVRMEITSNGLSVDPKMNYAVRGINFLTCEPI